MDMYYKTVLSFFRCTYSKRKKKWSFENTLAKYVYEKCF